MGRMSDVSFLATTSFPLMRVAVLPPRPLAPSGERAFSYLFCLCSFLSHVVFLLLALPFLSLSLPFSLSPSLSLSFPLLPSPQVSSLISLPFSSPPAPFPSFALLPSITPLSSSPLHPSPFSYFLSAFLSVSSVTNHRADEEWKVDFFCSFSEGINGPPSHIQVAFGEQGYARVKLG